MPLYLAENRTGNFHDITTDAAVNAYVTQQMNALIQQNVGGTILQVFTSGGSRRLFGTDEELARADVTPSDRSVLIQIQQNGIRPSPTYASLTVDTSVRGYLNLDGVPLSLVSWPSDFNLDKINDSEKEIIDTIIKLLKNKKVTDISEMSHREDGWKKTKRLEKISFEYAMNLNIIK